VELADAKHGKTIFTYLCTSCAGEFDVLGTMKDVPSATIISDRFDAGRNFCNKLWNAARFALMNLGDLKFQPLKVDLLAPEDHWILSRLNAATDTVNAHLEDYAPSAAVGAAREFFWNELCDWYLELIKPRMKDDAQAPIARQVLATVLDQVLRLFHPFVPFITEELWAHLGAQAPDRGVTRKIPVSELCINATWPVAQKQWRDEALEADFSRLQEVIRKVRELRSRHNVPPKKELPVAIRTPSATDPMLDRLSHLFKEMARVSTLEVGDVVTQPANSATQVYEDLEIFVGEVLDPAKERKRLNGQKAKLEKELVGRRRKLANEKFLSKAPPEVVEGEKQKVADMQSQLELVEKNLAALGD